MKTTKRIISILLSLMLVLGTVAVGGMSASALDGSAQLSIGSDTAIRNGAIMEREGTGWSISVNGNDVTLNLDNLVLENNDCCIIVYKLDLTITGSAKLTSIEDTAVFVFEADLTLDGDFYFISQDNYNPALYVGGDLTVNGGSLYAKTKSTNDFAIVVEKDITLNNGEAFALGDEYAKEVLIKVPGQPPYITGDTIEYGTYPQSKVEATEALRATAVAATWKSYNYYSGTGTDYDGQMSSGDFMEYADFFLDGKKYRAVCFTDYRPKYTDYQCGADYSDVDNNGYAVSTEENKKLYYFLYEPVKWRVLDPDEGLVMSETILDSQAYNNYVIKVASECYGDEGAETHSVYASDYANSSIRQWLNDDFYNTAFTDTQKENIKTSELDNRGYWTLTGDTTYTDLDSASTNDKVFLLSYIEVKNGDYGFENIESREAQGSDYAKCQGLYVSSDNSYWRLRTPGYSSTSTCIVNSSGHVDGYYYYSANYTSGGVRPALKLLNLKSDTEVAPIDPGMTLSVSPDAPVYGDTVTVTATLPEDAEGTVDFSLDDADSYTSVTVENGKAVYEIKGLSAGSHKVDAVYSGGGNYNGASATQAFTVSQKDLTIIANNQTYPYNGQIQGESDTVYEDSAVIKAKVAVEGLVEGDALTSITLDGAKKEIGEYEGEIVPSDAAIAEKTANYNISYTAGKLSITSVNCTLTINYEYATGGEAHESYTDNVAIFNSYSVTSPEITGYTPDTATVEGTMGDEDMDGKTVTVTYTANTYKVTYVVDGEKLTEMDVPFGQSVPRPRTPQRDGYSFKWVDEIPETMPAQDITINGKFTAIEYIATFVDENGETVKEVKFTVETEKLEEPEVPAKEGYEGAWEEYTIGANDITIRPVYTEESAAPIAVKGNRSNILRYKENQTFTADTSGLPEGTEVHWFVNGEDTGTGSEYTVVGPKDDYTIQAKVIDKDGNVLSESAEQNITVKHGFLDKILFFFAYLLKLLMTPIWKLKESI